jgi:hypothetical protein
MSYVLARVLVLEFLHWGRLLPYPNVRLNSKSRANNLTTPSIINRDENILTIAGDYYCKKMQKLVILCSLRAG